MKRALMAFVLFYMTISVYCQYTTPGTGVSWTLGDLEQQSGGAVTISGNVYVVNQAFTLSATDTLSVLQEVTLNIASAILVTIKGVLRIDSPQQVLITSTGSGQFFRGFRFENSNASVIRNALIEYGGGIQVISSDMLIENCIIRYFNKANTTGALQLSAGKTRIINNQFYENQGPAIASASNVLASPQIFDNQIWNNNSSNANTPQINLGNSSDTIRIINNTITGLYNNTGGIAVSTLAGGNVRCIIDNNIITNNRYGIAAQGSNLTGFIRNNIITNNNIQGNPDLGGSGLNFNGTATNRMIASGNTITGNLWGITVQGTAVPSLGEPLTNLASPGGNYIYGNTNNRLTYALYNNTTQNLKAQNNYWGSYNLDSVELYIVHQPDNPALGLVDYLPIMPPPTGLQAGKENIYAQQMIKHLFPNPFKNKLTIQFDPVLKPADEVSISIHDLTGRTLAHKKQQISGAVVEYENRGLKPGVYLLKVQAGGLMDTRTVIIAP